MSGDLKVLPTDASTNDTDSSGTAKITCDATSADANRPMVEEDESPSAVHDHIARCFLRGFAGDSYLVVDFPLNLEETCENYRRIISEQHRIPMGLLEILQSSAPDDDLDECPGVGGNRNQEAAPSSSSKAEPSSDSSSHPPAKPSNVMENSPATKRAKTGLTETDDSVQKTREEKCKKVDSAGKAKNRGRTNQLMLLDEEVLDFSAFDTFFAEGVREQNPDFLNRKKGMNAGMVQQGMEARLQCLPTSDPLEQGLINDLVNHRSMSITSDSANAALMDFVDSVIDRMLNKSPKADDKDMDPEKQSADKHIDSEELFPTYRVIIKSINFASIHEDHVAQFRTQLRPHELISRFLRPPQKYIVEAGNSSTPTDEEQQNMDDSGMASSSLLSALDLSNRENENAANNPSTNPPSNSGDLRNGAPPPESIGGSLVDSIGGKRPKGERLSLPIGNQSYRRVLDYRTAVEAYVFQHEYCQLEGDVAESSICPKNMIYGLGHFRKRKKGWNAKILNRKGCLMHFRRDFSPPWTTGDHFFGIEDSLLLTARWLSPSLQKTQKERGHRSKEDAYVQNVGRLSDNLMHSNRVNEIYGIWLKALRTYGLRVWTRCDVSDISTKKCLKDLSREVDSEKEPRLVTLDLGQDVEHLVYSQGYPLPGRYGIASYHFVMDRAGESTNDSSSFSSAVIDKGAKNGVDHTVVGAAMTPYICYASATMTGWRLSDNTLPPVRKYWENWSYDAGERRFRGDIIWNPKLRKTSKEDGEADTSKGDDKPNADAIEEVPSEDGTANPSKGETADVTFGGCGKWAYEMFLSEDFSHIENGTCTKFNADGEETGVDSFGQGGGLRYTLNLRLLLDYEIAAFMERNGDRFHPDQFLIQKENESKRGIEVADEVEDGVQAADEVEDAMQADEKSEEVAKDEVRGQEQFEEQCGKRELPPKELPRYSPMAEVYIDERREEDSDSESDIEREFIDREGRELDAADELDAEDPDADDLQIPEALLRILEGLGDQGAEAIQHLQRNPDQVLFRALREQILPERPEGIDFPAEEREDLESSDDSFKTAGSAIDTADATATTEDRPPAGAQPLSGLGLEEDVVYETASSDAED